MKLKILFFLILINVNSFSQNKDSTIKALRVKLVNARYCIYNIQDYVNLCTANSKLYQFEPSWVQRILKDYYFESGEIAPSRKELTAEKKKKKTIIKNKK